MAIRKLEPDEKEMIQGRITELKNVLAEIAKDDTALHNSDWIQLFFNLSKMKNLCLQSIKDASDLTKEKI